MARMLVIYKTPKDPAAFDKHYFEVHVRLAKKLPGLRQYETSRGSIVAPAGGSGFYMVAILRFDSLGRSARRSRRRKDAPAAPTAGSSRPMTTTQSCSCSTIAKF